MDQVSSTTQRETRKMPLQAGTSRAVVGKNIKEMMRNHPQEQAIAAALEKARKSKMTGKNGAKHYRKKLSKS